MDIGKITNNFTVVQIQSLLNDIDLFSSPGHFSLNKAQGEYQKLAAMPADQVDQSLKDALLNITINGNYAAFAGATNQDITDDELNQALTALNSGNTSVSYDVVTPPSGPSPTPGPGPNSNKNSSSNTVTVDEAPKVKIDTTGMTDQEIQNVKDYVKFLASDADGKKLLDAATKDGDYTISYDPSFKDGMGGETDVGNRTIKLSKKVIDNEAASKDANDIMGLSALGHEFVHAATGGDDSKQEESLASTIGARLAGRYYKQTIDENKTYDDWINGQTKSDAYKDLKDDNGVFKILSDMGIDVSGIKQHAPT
jgi:hypothetical protein